MVGLGEERNEVLQLMDDLRSANVDFLTIGQYLQPTRKHAAVERFVTPEEFAGYEKMAYGKGFLMVAASPLTRSSYHAGDDFARLRAAREAHLARLSPDAGVTGSGHRLSWCGEIDICAPHRQRNVTCPCIELDRAYWRPGWTIAK